ncbi:L-2-hydroxyglutarate oxidase [Acidiluteibacter ferrifornacis]|uniref:L-2-hydroxyglutarate oxidase n=1 Tax=Acidiluteibacter ferrifornacis TaxID=2692424 RepID=A0A6N9NN56_9FLAO|nr:L-2-hydroxyglutarate oxidase [Acidiluteibacter ferrifornacis]NBG65995.1 L-2-hydroxyglutarate oxidase [Acidiluteibacter ferrifornacis]
MTLDTNQIYDVTIVGGGIVGAATLYKLQNKFPNLKILLLEKEEVLAGHQTGHNSGVIHSGLYYKPGSKKAINCVKGRHELVQFSKDYKVNHDVCGKVVVATDKSELPFLDKIFNNGIANNTEGIEKIDGNQVKDIEPYCEGIAGIWVPCTGIIDFVGATNRFAEVAIGKQPNSKVSLGEEFRSIVHHDDQATIKTNRGQHETKHVIFCGGLQSDRLAKKDNVDIDLKIVGFRGDYYDLSEQGMHKVKNLIYPVPNPAFPFLGVHFTRMVNGGVECGPNAVFTFKREGYKKTDFDLADTADALSYGGTWKLFAKHWKFGLDEYRRAFSKPLFLKTLQKLIPSLKMEDLQPGRAGVRAMALGQDGEMIEDFKIEFKDNCIHVLNAPSPAATACLAIGEDITEMAEKQFGLKN